MSGMALHAIYADARGQLPAWSTLKLTCPVAVLRAGRDACQSCIEGAAAIVRHCRVSAHLRFSRVQPCAKAGRLCLLNGALRVGHQVDTQGRSASLAQCVCLFAIACAWCI